MDDFSDDFPHMEPLLTTAIWDDYFLLETVETPWMPVYASMILQFQAIHP